VEAQIQGTPRVEEAAAEAVAAMLLREACQALAVQGGLLAAEMRPAVKADFLEAMSWRTRTQEVMVRSFLRPHSESNFLERPGVVKVSQPSMVTLPCQSQRISRMAFRSFTRLLTGSKCQAPILYSMEVQEAAEPAQEGRCFPYPVTYQRFRLL
jgi:hypothetical protein